MDKYLFLLYVASGICSMAEGSAAILEKNPLSGSVYAVEWQDKEESCCQANGCLCPYPPVAPIGDEGADLRRTSRKVFVM